MENTPLSQKIHETVEISIRLIFLFLLVAWCFALLSPFLITVLWAIIIAVSISPLYLYLNQKLRWRPSRAASAIAVLMIAILIIPSALLIDSLAQSGKKIAQSLIHGEMHIPPPAESIKSIPLAGEKLFTAWSAAAEDPKSFLQNHAEQLRVIGKKIVQSIMAISQDIFKLILSIIIASILLATPGTRSFCENFFKKMVGARGVEFAQIAEKTILNVTKGILGVALIQSLVMLILFLLAGVPHPGVLFILCLALGIMQIPAVPVSLIAIYWLFAQSGYSTGMQILWTVLILIGGLADNILKPILLGKGAPVPMLVIFLGAIGGFMLSGFLGLFSGAIVLSLGYKLFLAWLEPEAQA